MSEPPVITERAGPVCTIILNRPEKRNAVDRPTAEALHAAFLDFANDDALRVAVLTGARVGTFVPARTSPR